MKKLLFATAIVVSVAAFGDPINATDFESGSLDGYFAYESESGSTDSSAVSNYVATGLVVPSVGPNWTDRSVNNAYYLTLDTEGGTLWRSIIDSNDGNQLGADYPLGDPRQVAATGTYLDTLVQFTVTEDDAPTTTEGDKLAIWLQASDGATNLMVRAAYYDVNGTPTATNFVLTGKMVEPNTWYRLTVKAVLNVINTEGAYGSFYNIPAFVVYVDGTEMAATEKPIADNLANLDGAIASEFTTLVADNKVFPSLVPGSSEEPATLQGVGFKGTGVIDDVVWTEENPFPAVPVEFTLTFSGAENAAVSYVIGEGASVTWDGSSTISNIAANTSVTVTSTPSNNFTYAGVTLPDGWTLDNNVISFTTNVTADTALAVPNAVAIPSSYPTYLDNADATIKAKYDAWKAGVGCDDATASQYLNQFLLNVDEGTTVGDAALEITAIKKNETAGWDITIGCSISGVDLTGTVGTAYVCNGYLSVSYTDDLTGTWTTENINITSVDSTTGTVTVNVNKSDAKFMKVSLKSTAEPQS